MAQQHRTIPAQRLARSPSPFSSSPAATVPPGLVRWPRRSPKRSPAATAGLRSGQAHRVADESLIPVLEESLK
jgi:hypothetical protein